MDSDTARLLRMLEQRIARLETKPAPLWQLGTYTPTYLGATTPGATTYSLQEGFWRRVNDIVFFNGRVTWTAATGTGTALISLPVTAATAPAGTYRWAGAVYTTNVTFANGSIQSLITQAGTTFSMQSPLTNAAGNVVVMEAAGDVIFSGWYFV